jgi:hypothetical protein
VHWPSAGMPVPEQYTPVPLHAHVAVEIAPEAVEYLPSEQAAHADVRLACAAEL